MGLRDFCSVSSRQVKRELAVHQVFSAALYPCSNPSSCVAGITHCIIGTSMWELTLSMYVSIVHTVRVRVRLYKPHFGSQCQSAHR